MLNPFHKLCFYFSFIGFKDQEELIGRRMSCPLSEYYPHQARVVSDSKYLRCSRRINTSSLPISNLSRLCQHLA